MPKFNVHSDYFNHPKVQRLKLYCGEEADIFPIRLWSFCAQYFMEDGALKGYSEPEIERVLGWKGVPGNLLKALLELRFVERSKDGVTYKVHDWQHHAGFLMTYRENGRKGGVNSGISRRLKIEAASTLASTRGSTKEKNRIEKNKDYIEPAKNAVPKADRPLTDLQKVVLVFKVCQGFDKNDKAWDTAHFARCSKAAKTLLDFTGSWKDAGDCIQDIYEKLTSKGLTVTLETIVKHSAEWLKDKREKEASNGVFHRQSHGIGKTEPRTNNPVAN